MRRGAWALAEREGARRITVPRMASVRRAPVHATCSLRRFDPGRSGRGRRRPWRREKCAPPPMRRIPCAPQSLITRPSQWRAADKECAELTDARVTAHQYVDLGRVQYDRRGISVRNVHSRVSRQWDQVPERIEDHPGVRARDERLRGWLAATCPAVLGWLRIAPFFYGWLESLLW